MSVNIVYPKPVTDYTTAAAYFSYIENKIYNEQRLTKELYSMGVITESSSLYITEADGGATNNLWQRFIAFLRSIANKFNESMAAFRKDNNGYLKKYEDIIKHRPLKGGPYTFAGDYTLGMQRINALNTDIQNVDFDQDYAKYKDQLTSDNDFDFASVIAKDLKAQNNEDLNTALKNYFLGADAEEHKFAADKIDLSAIYNTCVDKNNRIGDFDKVVDTVNKTQPKITTNNNSNNNGNNKNQPKRQKKNNTPQSSTNSTQQGVNNTRKHRPMQRIGNAVGNGLTTIGNAIGNVFNRQHSSYIDYDVFSYFNEAKNNFPDVDVIKKEIDDLCDDMGKALKNAEGSEKEITDNKIATNNLEAYAAFSADRKTIANDQSRLQSIQKADNYGNISDNDLNRMHITLENFKKSINDLNSQIATEKSKKNPPKNDAGKLREKMRDEVISVMQDIKNKTKNTNLTQDQKDAISTMDEKIAKATGDNSNYDKVKNKNITDDKTLQALSNDINTLKGELKQLQDTLKNINPDTGGDKDKDQYDNIESLGTAAMDGINRYLNLKSTYRDYFGARKKPSINANALNIIGRFEDAYNAMKDQSLTGNKVRSNQQKSVAIVKRINSSNRGELKKIEDAAKILNDDSLYKTVEDALNKVVTPQSPQYGSDKVDTEDDETQDTGEDTEETTEDEQQDDQTNEEQNKAFRKWTTTMTSIYSASCTAYEKIVKDYMELLRMHVRSYAGEKQENNNTVNIGG